MSTPLTTIRNIGPATAAALERAGIDSAEALHALGPDAAYARLLAQGARPHVLAWTALVMGLMGRPWTDCRGAEKAALRARFDRLCAEAAAAGGDARRRDAALAEIGVLPRAR